MQNVREEALHHEARGSVAVRDFGSRPLRIALIGQPNCGKSTIFNHLVGYKANTSNLPGTTVEYLSSHALVGGQRLEVIDLPGTYSLTSLDEAEAETRNFLLNEPIDAVLNVADASLLSRSLELTLQLLELGTPMALCLNMVDEARRKGIDIDAEVLSEQLGIPVIPAVAVRGTGVMQAAVSATRIAREHAVPPPPTYSRDIESAIHALTQAVEKAPHGRSLSNARLTAIKLLESDPLFVEHARGDSPGLLDAASTLRNGISAQRGRSGEAALSAERHSTAMDLFEQVATVGTPIRSARDRIDRFLMHPVFGVIALGAILYTLFFVVFKVGTLVEAPLLGWFDRSIDFLAGVIPPEHIGFFAIRGVVQGIAGALGIVFPYLVPFLIGLALLEDIGYLPRAGYLIDGLMHRIGLHGKSVIPFILGYGCSVPAVMATRILDSKRDRFVTAMLSLMVPCVARTTIIYGLIGYYLGPHLAFLLYVINIIVIAAAGKLLTVLLPRVTPGLILEIPSYKIPSAHVIGAKVWLRIHEFLRYALPVLVVGSLVMSLLEFADVSRYLNLAVSPITWSLGLPLALGVPLIFGVFRKELSLVMLFQAMGTAQLATVLTAGQMMTYTLFVLFYVPCIATIAVLRREFGNAQTGLIIVTTTGIALIVALLGRGGFALFG
jgi:ferrous iron transport protein B